MVGKVFYSSLVTMFAAVAAAQDCFDNLLLNITQIGYPENGDETKVLLKWTGGDSPQTVRVLDDNNTEVARSPWRGNNQGEMVIPTDLDKPLTLGLEKGYAFEVLGADESPLTCARQFVIPTVPFNYFRPADDSWWCLLPCQLTGVDDDCTIIIHGGTGGPPPAVFEIYLDGELKQSIVRNNDEFVRCSDRQGPCPVSGGFCIASEPILLKKGKHTLEIRGVITKAAAPNHNWPPFEGKLEGSYIGNSRRYTISVPPEPEVVVPPPKDLLPRQILYGPGVNGDAVLLTWAGGKSPEPYLNSIDVYLDDFSRVYLSLPGDTIGYYFFGLTPGPHKIGLQGNDGGVNDKSTIAETSIKIVELNPHPHPLNSILYSWSPDNGGTGRFLWEYADPSEWLDIYYLDKSDLIYIGSLALSAQANAVFTSPVSMDDILALQFFRTVDGKLYGSDFIGNAPLVKFIRGLCDGEGELPGVTSAIYGLKALFIQGSPEPPCWQACDANSDGNVDIADFVYLLLYVFLGGPPPSSWGDLNNNSTVDPSCEFAVQSENCQSSHALCH